MPATEPDYRESAALALAYEPALFADYMAAEYGTRWYVVGQTYGYTVDSCEASSHLEGDALEIARSPGVANLDSREWTDGLVWDDLDGEWSCGDEVIGPFGAGLVRWTVANGDVTRYQDALAKQIREALVRA